MRGGGLRRLKENEKGRGEREEVSCKCCDNAEVVGGPGWVSYVIISDLYMAVNARRAGGTRMRECVVLDGWRAGDVLAATA